MAILQAFLIALLCVPASGQELAAKADAYFAELARQGKFSGSILIAKNGKTEFAKGYGLANVEWQVPNTADTVFRIGSITKQFTAVAILQLAEQGKLKLEDPACDYLPACPEPWKAVTIHQLVSNTSGIPNFTNEAGYQKIQVLPSRYDEQVKLVWNKPLDFAPGTKFGYSNTGFLLLGKVIEKAAGMSMEEYFAEKLFAPAGMKATRIEQPGQVIPRLATGYRGNGGRPSRASYIDMRIPGAAGAAVSTVEDLLAWDNALAQNKLIRAESRQKMVTPVQGSYGYGTIAAPVMGKATVGHNGGIDGFASTYLRFIEDGTVAVALMNQEDAAMPEILQGLAQLATGGTPTPPAQRQEVDLEEALLSEYVGRYEFAPVFSITLRLVGKQLISQATNQPAIPVFAEKKDVLFPKVVPATLEITCGPDGKVDGLILRQAGREMKAKKVE
jgi:CubicO group peptidase (beta-lactamase class C family)